MVSFVSLFDAKKGEYVKQARYTLSPKDSLIVAIMQYNGNYNTWEYPKEMDGIYKSKMVKDRLLFNLTDDLILESQLA